MSKTCKLKHQVDHILYATTKIVLILISNTAFDRVVHVPEKIDDIERGIDCPDDDYYGTGKGKDYYGNDRKLPCLVNSNSRELS